MMVHPPDEGPHIAEHAFDLGRLSELPAGVDVDCMLHRPPLLDATVYLRAIGIEPGLRFHVLLEESDGVMALDRLLRQDHVRDLSGFGLLRHYQGPPLAVRFIELHDLRENIGIFGQVLPEIVVPAADGQFGESGERHGLLHGNLRGPAPEHEPPSRERHLDIPQPRMREKRKAPAAPRAPVPLLRFPYLAVSAVRTEHVFSKQRPP